MTRKLFNGDKMSPSTIRTSKGIVQIFAIFAILGFVSCISIRTYSPGDDAQGVKQDSGGQIGPQIAP